MSAIYCFSTLMPNEKVLFEAQGVVLTTHRLRSVYNQQMKSLMVSEITSCRITYSDNPALVIIGLLALLGGIIISGNTQNPAFAGGGVLLALFFIFVYFQTREGRVVVATPTLNIDIAFAGKNWDAMTDLVDKIENAKDFVERLGGYRPQTQSPYQ